MKRIITWVLLMIPVSVYSQNYMNYNIDFEDTSQFFRLEIDTISNPDNIWQIGKPQKTVFTSAYSLPNAIITDTFNYYAPDDTSSFTIKHVASQGFEFHHIVTLSGKYQVNSDSLTDFGIIEFSPDNGSTWVNLLTDTIYQNQNCYHWWNVKPSLTGNSTGWTDFYVWVGGFGNVFTLHYGDTVLYRFTFISDSIQTYKDGLMFDDLYFEDLTEGISEVHHQFKTKVFPNPTLGITHIGFKNKKNATFQFVLYDSEGRNILIKKATDQAFIEVDLSNFKSGIYFFRLLNQGNGQISSGKIMKVE